MVRCRICDKVVSSATANREKCWNDKLCGTCFVIMEFFSFSGESRSYWSPSDFIHKKLKINNSLVIKD